MSEVKETIKNVRLLLPAELHRDLKIRAATENSNIRKIIMEMIETEQLNRRVRHGAN